MFDFYLENGNVSAKVRNEMKATELDNLATVLADAGYVLDGKSLYKVLGTDAKTGNTVRARVDVVVTDR